MQALLSYRMNCWRSVGRIEFGKVACLRPVDRELLIRLLWACGEDRCSVTPRSRFEPPSHCVVNSWTTREIDGARIGFSATNPHALSPIGRAAPIVSLKFGALTPSVGHRLCPTCSPVRDKPFGEAFSFKGEGSSELRKAVAIEQRTRFGQMAAPATGADAIFPL